MNMNCNHVTLLVLVDLSSAFDIVDHKILLVPLKSSIGINGTALNWFTSYLNNGSHESRQMALHLTLRYGVPQGSSLGPLLFAIYFSKLFEVIKYHLSEAPTYADDTQLYLSFSPGSATNQTDAVVAMERCRSDIRTLCLRISTNLMMTKLSSCWLVQNSNIPKLNIDSLAVGIIDVAPVTVPRNLGTWFDSNLNLQEQIHQTCKSGFFHLYNIRRIRKYLSQESASTLVHAFIIGPILRLLQQPSIWFTLCSVYLNCNASRMPAARVISNVPRAPVLCSLHWLPVKFRIDFKIHIYGHAPGYLIDLIAIKEQPRHLRSASYLILKFKTEKDFRGLCFFICGP